MYTILKGDEFYEKKIKFKYSKQTDLVLSCMQFQKKKKMKKAYWESDIWIFASGKGLLLAIIFLPQIDARLTKYWW